MFQATPYKTHIQAEKFFPPTVESSQILYRKRIIEFLLRQNRTERSTLVVEAQAGQGKTTIIQQLLDQLPTASVWYQVGPEDADPVFFLQGILEGFKTQLPDIPINAQIFEECDFTLFNQQKQIYQLIKTIEPHFKDDLILVLDDLHYLSDHDLSLALLNNLLENAPPRLNFILSSREPLALDYLQSKRSDRNLLHIGNHDLALNEEEISNFFHQLLNIDLCRDNSKEIAQRTDGWVMGVLLLSLQMEQQQGKRSSCFSNGSRILNEQNLHSYFREEILSPLDSRLHRPLLLLSFLETIPIDLAIEITGSEGIGNDLCTLAHRNCFIHRLNADNSQFRMHHLFRQFLQEKARKELAAEIIDAVNRQAGQFCRKRNNAAKALRYLLSAEDYNAVETVLKESGMVFLATNQTATLTAILQEIPSLSMQKLGWSSLFLALAKLDTAPAQALPLLDQALEVFSARQDEIGELLCLAHIISIRITTTGYYREGEALLKRAEQLFFQTTEELDTLRTILVTRSLAMGYCVFLADTEQATKFASLALNLAANEKLVNFEAALLMIMGYIQIFAGNTALSQMYLEKAAPYIHHAEVGSFNRLAIRMMLFNFLFNNGDFTNYFKQKYQLIESIGETMVVQSIAGPFCFVWEIDIAINRGEIKKALDLSTQVRVQHPSLSPHLHSLILQQRGLALALNGQQDQALLVAKESQRLRELADSPFFVTLNKLVVGQTCTHSDRYDQALQLLSEGIEAARQMPSEYLEATALLHRASAYLRTGNLPSAQPDIVAGLKLMRRNDYRHIWAWPAEEIRQILSFAAAHGIEIDYARRLARERLDQALLDDGKMIPLLEIRTLGSFKILRKNVVIAQAEDLTPVQREMLCLLLATPEFKLPQETIQLHFWPDSPPDTAKVKLDTLVSRLRKTLTQTPLGDMTGHYLKRQKGMLWLEHCRVDAEEFQTSAKRGLRHLHLRENWQANNAFTLAETLWQGEFFTGVSGEDHIRSYRQELNRTLIDMTLGWGQLLTNAKHAERAIQLTEKALLSDPLNERLYGQLYRLHGHSSTVQARRVGQRFTARLQNEGYSEDEIAELFDSINIDLF